MPLALLALAGWTLFAFAGAYRWTVVPTMVLAISLAVVARPRILSGRTRWIDLGLLVCLAAIAAQLVPLPTAWRDGLTPGAARLDALLRVTAEPPSFAPIAVDPSATAWALAEAVSLVAIFWTARAIFESGGLRLVARGLAWMGLTLAVIVFVQRFSSPHHIYGFWAPVTRTATPTPFGPYVNRNDLATWLLMAIPLVIGYTVGRTVRMTRGRHWRHALVRGIDSRVAWLGGAVVLMVAALVASLSRSGLAGVLIAFLLLAVASRRQLGGGQTRVLAGVMAGLLLLALPFTNLSAMTVRLGAALPADVVGRVAIWRDSWAMARDFLVTGLGAGGFERGMLVYQHEPRALFFNHAHNEYLQLLAEGGVLLCAPALLVVVAGLRTAARRLTRDRTMAFWFRIGALGGVAAVAVQSLWDTGLRMPANAVLFAIVAAMAVHRSPHGQRVSGPDRRESPAPRVLAFPARDHS